MNKKVSVGITAAFIFIAITITFTATMIYAMNLFDQKIISVRERASMYDKISEIDSAIRQNFYKSVDDDALIAAMAQGYFGGLGDEDTKYLRPGEIAAMQQSIKGVSIGVGLITEENASGYAVVTRVVEDSAASKVGIEAGDIIIKVNGEDALTMGYAAVQKSLFGIEGEKASLVYSRGGEEKSAELVYTVIENASVQYSMVDDYCYIRITDFNLLTVSQFDYALNFGLSEENLKGYVLDVRGLAKGYDIEVVAEMLDEIMPVGTIISGVYIGDETKVLYTSDSNSLRLPIAVLVDEKTRGFAELFAAALGELDYVQIVGTQTAGKGTYQELIQLTDGSGIYVTVCRLLAAGTVDFDGVGVTPDFIVAANEDFVLGSGEPNKLADLQLRKAIEVIEVVDCPAVA